MKIGFDAKRLFLNNTGLGNYSRTLVRNLIKYHPEHEYLLYTPRVEKNIETEYFLNQDNVTIVTPNGRGGSFWRSKGIMKQMKDLDVYHGLSNELPFGIDQLNVKSIVTIHDVIFKRYPKQYPFFDRLGYNLKTKKAIQQSDKIIAISHQTEQDIINYFHAPVEKINLLYQSCNPFYTDNPISPSEIDSDYFLYVGSVIERKNLLSILKAMKKISENDRKKLVVVGKGGSYYDTCRSYASANGLDGFVDWKGNMDNLAIKELYKNAIALIYPSIFEGFGIPVIESMYAGRPVITSNLSSLKEAGGEAALLVDPFNVEEIRSAMESMSHVTEREKYKTKISKHLAQFDPKILSEKLMSIYLTKVSKHD